MVFPNDGLNLVSILLTIEKTLSTGASSYGNISRAWISLFNLPNVARPDGPFILKILDHQASGLTDLAIGQSESSMSLNIIFLGGSNFRETPVN